MVQWFYLISWRLFDACTSYFGIMNQYDPRFDLKINVGHCDLHFMVQWFLSCILKTIWCTNIIIWDNELVWPCIWPQNKCRSLWPIFPGQVILPYILKTIRCVNIIIWDYESVWPQNKYRSLWSIFHASVILHYILNTIWCINIILCDYGSVWPDDWPKNKCRSLWRIFHSPVILSYISKTIWCMSVIFSDNETVWPKFDLKVNICQHDLYFMV